MPEVRGTVESGWRSLLYTHPVNTPPPPPDLLITHHSTSCGRTDSDAQVWMKKRGRAFALI